MSAKHKLNSFHLYGILFVAGIVGGATGSFTVFFIVLGALLAAALHSGNIRR